MRELPRGTVTLLFTDIEGSTTALRELGRSRYAEALRDHRRLLRETFVRHGGTEVEMQGDSFHFAFEYARDAVAAAAAAQRALAHHEWQTTPLSVRIGAHTGEPMEVDGLYAGLDVHRAARVMSVGHGGQVLVSQRTADLVDGELGESLSVVPVGRYQLKDIPEPEELYQVVGPDLRAEFPPLKAASVAGRLTWRRRRLRAAVAAVAIAAVAAAVVLGSDSGGPAVVANSVVAIDPGTNEITDVIPVGATPSSVAGSAGGVWVLNADDQTITRIDPAERRAIRTIAVGLNPTELAAAGESVWVSDAQARLMKQIDGATNRVAAEIQLPRLGTGYAGGADEQFAATVAAVWIANEDRTVARIDSATGRVAATIPARDVGAVAVGAGAVWVAGFGTVFRIDPTTNTVAGEIDVPKTDPGGITAIATGAGFVWVTAAKDGLLWQIDARRLELRRSIDVGRLPNAIAVGHGSVWVANTLDGSVSRIEPRDGRVTATISISRPVRDIAIVDDRVWVTVN